FGGSFLRAFSTVVPAGNVNVSSAIVTTIDGGIPPTGSTTSAQQTTIVPLQVQVAPSFPGGNAIDFRDQSGFRLTLGRWLDDEKGGGVEANFFWLPRHSVTLSNVLNPQIITVDTGIPQQQITVSSATGTTPATVVGPTTISTVLFTANLSSSLTASTSNE